MKITRSILLTLLIAFNCYAVSSYGGDNPDVDKVYELLGKLNQFTNIDNIEEDDLAELTSHLKQQTNADLADDVAAESVDSELSQTNDTPQTLTNDMASDDSCEAADFADKATGTSNPADLKIKCLMSRSDKAMHDFKNKPSLKSAVRNLEAQMDLNRAFDADERSDLTVKTHCYHQLSRSLSLVCEELRKEGYYDASIDVADAVLARYDTDGELHVLSIFNKSSSLIKQERYQECAELFSQLMELQPTLSASSTAQKASMEAYQYILISGHQVDFNKVKYLREEKEYKKALELTDLILSDMSVYEDIPIYNQITKEHLSLGFNVWFHKSGILDDVVNADPDQVDFNQQDVDQHDDNLEKQLNLLRELTRKLNENFQYG